MRSCLQMADTRVSSVAPGCPRMRRTIAAHWRTGHSNTSPERSWVAASIRSSFFCHSKVVETQSAHSSSGWSCGISTPSRKKRMFLSLRQSVRRFSAWATLRHSHDRHAKKTAPVESWLVALWVSATADWAASFNTMMGRAFCWTGLGSSFLKPLNRRCRSLPSSPSSSFVGFVRSLSLKDDATNEMEFLIVPSAKVS